MAFIEGWPHLRGGLYEGFHCIGIAIGAGAGVFAVMAVVLVGVILVVLCCRVRRNSKSEMWVKAATICRGQGSGGKSKFPINQCIYAYVLGKGKTQVSC